MPKPRNPRQREAAAPSNDRIARLWRGAAEDPEQGLRFDAAVLDLLAAGRLTPGRVDALCQRLDPEEVDDFCRELEWLASDQALTLDGPSGEAADLRARLFALGVAGEAGAIDAALAREGALRDLAAAVVETGYAAAGSHVLLLPGAVRPGALAGIEAQDLHDLTRAGLAALALGQERGLVAMTGQLLARGEGAAGEGPELRVLLGVVVSLDGGDDDGLGLARDLLSGAAEPDPEEDEGDAPAGAGAEGDGAAAGDEDGPDEVGPDEDAAYLEAMAADWSGVVRALFGEGGPRIDRPVPWALARRSLCRLLLEETLRRATPAGDAERLVLCDTRAGIEVAALRDGAVVARCLLPEALLACDGADVLADLSDVYETVTVERPEDLPR